MIRHFKSVLGSTALAAILASAAITATPSAALADARHDDHARPQAAHFDDHGRFDRDDHRDDHRDNHPDNRAGDHGVVIINRPVASPVVVAPPTNQVWIEPVYRTISQQVYVAPTYRSVTDHVWYAPVVQKQTERVWVPDEYKTIPNPFSAASSQRVLVKKAHYENRGHDVVLKPGYYQDVTRQELVCDGHYETVTHQELVTAGHWVDGCAVAVDPAPRQTSGFHFDIHF